MFSTFKFKIHTEFPSRSSKGPPNTQEARSITSLPIPSLGTSYGSFRSDVPISSFNIPSKFSCKWKKNDEELLWTRSNHLNGREDHQLFIHEYTLPQADSIIVTFYKPDNNGELDGCSRQQRECEGCILYCNESCEARYIYCCLSEPNIQLF